MLEQNEVTIKDLKVTGPLAGKKLEIQFDIKPIEKEKPKDTDKDKDKNKDKDKDKDKATENKKSSEKKSTDTGGLGFLFFLLFALIFTVAQTGGFSSLNYSESNTPETTPYRYQPAFR